MANRSVRYLAITTVVLGLGYSNVQGYASAERKVETYCDNVKLHNETSGRLGWPDYKGTAAELCLNP